MTTEPKTGDYVKTYTLDNAAVEERGRLRCVEEIWDPGSISCFERLGVSDGWNALMVAAGAGSLVERIARQVGPTGSIVATDLDPRLLAWLRGGCANVEVRKHNIVTEDLPLERFDLVHTRLLLAYLPEREEVIGKLVKALRPGGWLVVEDFDAGSFGGAYPTAASEKVRLASAKFHETSGYDHYTGRRLPGWLRKAGLVDVDGVGSVFPLRGSRAEALTEIYLVALRQQCSRMIEAGLITKEDFEGAERRYSDPEYDHLSHTMMTVWGRRAQ